MHHFETLAIVDFMILQHKILHSVIFMTIDTESVLQIQNRRNEQFLQICCPVRANDISQHSNLIEFNYINHENINFNVHSRVKINNVCIYVPFDAI